MSQVTSYRQLARRVRAAEHRGYRRDQGQKDQGQQHARNERTEKGAGLQSFQAADLDRQGNRGQAAARVEAVWPGRGQREGWYPYGSLSSLHSRNFRGTPDG